MRANLAVSFGGGMEQVWCWKEASLIGEKGLVLWEKGASLVGKKSKFVTVRWGGSGQWR